jgi:phosphate uptake regulator
MSRRPYHERHFRKLQKIAQKTIFVSLPKDFVEELGWKPQQKVLVSKKGDTLVVSVPKE